ncbi:LysR substrate-binding domain-containing protein [Schlegelella sp. S2-27]|uniref:LysR substrate-binding domain-containing protein n=1 Tax=Caldimonas mangrovi TaxID=2944811 RepID=A0ABT0YJM0_9BURK|nr:LysR substrate-binding domain-containing protein [Caldimonas mangrovi]MCM5678924.1 LysR substrate-binding domain-containing protein [Caldimonas mangrovi]
MRILSPSLSELHAFVCTARSGSFTEAAAALSVTQAAVSRAVLRLEQRVGCTLLHRSPQGISLTARGRSYFEEVSPALALLETAARKLRTPGSTREPLRLCVIPSLNTRWLVPRLSGFRAQHPHVELIFKTYLVDDDFLRPDIDCWVQTRHSPTQRWPRHVKASYLVGREIVPVCHPSIAARIRAPADLLQYPLLHHANYPGNWQIWLQAAAWTGAEVELGPGFDLVSGIVEAVMSGLGVAVVQRCLIERELQERRLVIPLPVAASTGRGYYVCIPKAAPRTLALQGFEDWLLQAAKEANDGEPARPTSPPARSGRPSR